MRYFFPLSLCMDYRVRRTLFPSGWCFSYLVTTRWIFYISLVSFYLVTTRWIFFELLCENSINQSTSSDFSLNTYCPMAVLHGSPNFRQSRHLSGEQAADISYHISSAFGQAECETCNEKEAQEIHDAKYRVATDHHVLLLLRMMLLLLRLLQLLQRHTEISAAASVARRGLQLSQQCCRVVDSKAAASRFILRIL